MLASFQGLYKWHISFNYALICKGRIWICAWRMTDYDWKTIKIQMICKKEKFSEMFPKLSITSCSITGESGCDSEGISVTLLTLILAFNKVPTSNPSLLRKSFLPPVHYQFIANSRSFWQFSFQDIIHMACVH